MNQSNKWWKNDTLIKTYDQLQMLIIKEISLVCKKMLTFIDHKLHDIKQAHDKL
jgi:hypothetical protein